MATIISAGLAILAFGAWLIKRHLQKQDQPQTRYETNKHENARIIADGDAAGLNRKLDASLDQLPDANRHDSSR